VTEPDPTDDSRDPDEPPDDGADEAAWLLLLLS
jgi:hypothetical protein